MIFLFYSILIIFIILIYSFIILKKTNYPLINLYLIVNIIIFYLPALLFSLFGLTHPSMSYENNYVFEYTPYILYTIFLVLTFDVVMYSSFYLFHKRLKINIHYLDNIKGITKDHDFKLFFIIIFLSAICFDFFTIVLNNSFMNQNYILCNPSLSFFLKTKHLVDSVGYIKNLKQVFSEFSNIKFYLLIISLLYYINNKSKTNGILLFIILIYNFILALFIGSKFSIALIFIIIFCINYNSILKIKNIILTLIIFYLSLYMFPIIGTIRNFYYKNYNEEKCKIIVEKFKQIYQVGLNYNNNYISENHGILNKPEFVQLLTEQTFLNKPLEIILSRLNYFDITMRSINLKLNNFIENNYMFYLDNIYGLIPRILYPNKNIITNNSNYLAVDLGVLNQPTHAVGLRPIAEGFYYLGYYYIIIAVILGFLFYIFKSIYIKNDIIIKSCALYISILMIKRDSFHALLPGFFHEILIGAYLILIAYLINIYVSKYKLPK